MLIVGAGGLGSPVALALAAAPAGLLGGIGIVDDDRVELSNLHRQLLHGAADLGQPKVESAQRTLHRRAPRLQVTPIAARLGPGNAAQLLAGYQIVVDGSDSIETKFLVSDTAVRLGVPAVIGGVLRWSGQLMTVLPGESACYRCLFEAPPPPGSSASCQQAGVLGPSCGVIGALQAQEVLRLLRRERPLWAGAILSADLLGVSLRRVPVRRRLDCPGCAGPASVSSTLVNAEPHRSS